MRQAISRTGVIQCVTAAGLLVGASGRAAADEVVRLQEASTELRQHPGDAARPYVHFRFRAVFAASVGASRFLVKSRCDDDEDRVEYSESNRDARQGDVMSIDVMAFAYRRLAHIPDQCEFAIRFAPRPQRPQRLAKYCWVRQTGTTTLGPCSNAPKGVRRLRRRCDEGSADACRQLGEAHLHGRGVERQEELARDLFERACSGGAAAACTQLGLLHHDPYRRGAAQPARAAQETALALFVRACEGGHAEGCRLSAYTQELLRALEERATAPLYRRACDLGDERACETVASYLAWGQGGLTRNPARAVAIRERLCRGGYIPSCHQLGIHYLRGDDGVPRDEQRGLRLEQKACQAGLAAACAYLQRQQPAQPAETGTPTILSRSP
jgi:hypothetical protein